MLHMSPYHMWIFTPNHVVTKFCFWYFMSQLRKVKKSSGEIVYCGKSSRNPPWGEELWHLAILWFPQWHPQHVLGVLRPPLQALSHGAPKMWVPGTAHWAHSIQIMKVEEIIASKCCQLEVKQFDDKIKFLLLHLGPVLPAQAMLHQEAQCLLLDVEPPCPQVCPNKLLGKTKRSLFLDRGEGRRFLSFLRPYKTLQILLSKPTEYFDRCTYMCCLGSKEKKPHISKCKNAVIICKLWP